MKERSLVTARPAMEKVSIALIKVKILDLLLFLFCDAFRFYDVNLCDQHSLYGGSQLLFDRLIIGTLIPQSMQYSTSFIYGRANKFY